MLKILRVVLPLLIAALLIGGLVYRSDLSLSEFLATLRQVSPAAIAGILACTALFLLLSTLKWRLVMSHMTSVDLPTPGWNFSLYYTSLGAILSLVITPHAAMPLSRSFGTRVHSKGSAIASAAASAYEQIFDVVPLVTMSLSALVAIALRTGFSGWLAIVIGLNGAAFCAMVLVFRTRFWSVAERLPMPGRARAKLHEKLDWFASPAAKTLLGTPFVAMLFAISLARYVVILLRTGIVMASVALPIGAFQFVKAYGVARLSSLVSITPGELGISEWTWSGVLSWMGFRLDDAARFVLVNRVCNIASLVAVFAIVWLGFMFGRATGISANSE